MNFDMKEYIDKQIGVSCCSCPVELIFKPFENPNPAALLRCKKCYKELQIVLSKSIKFSCDDPVFSESIDILAKEWKSRYECK